MGYIKQHIDFHKLRNIFNNKQGEVKKIIEGIKKYVQAHESIETNLSTNPSTYQHTSVYTSNDWLELFFNFLMAHNIITENFKKQYASIDMQTQIYLKIYKYILTLYALHTEMNNQRKLTDAINKCINKIINNIHLFSATFATIDAFIQSMHLNKNTRYHVKRSSLKSTSNHTNSSSLQKIINAHTRNMKVYANKMAILDTQNFTFIFINPPRLLEVREFQAIKI